MLGLVVACDWIILWRRTVFRGEETKVSRTLLISALCLCAVVIGALRFGIATDQMLKATQSLATGSQTITGRVVLPPDVRDTTTILTVSVADTRVLATVDRHTDVFYGDTVSLRGQVTLPKPFATEFGRSFDYVGFLQARGVTHVMRFPEVEVTAPAAHSLRGTLYTVRDSFIAKLQLLLSEPAASLGAGILLGAKSGLPNEVEESFAVTGIIHIVVLSGYNIMLVVVFVLTIGSFLFPYRVRLLVAIGAVLLFGLMVGFAPSVARACLMATLVLVSYLLARPQGALRALALAAFFIVCLNPYTLRYDIGFQFSFMATLGLVMITPVIERYLQSHGWWTKVQALLIATIATQIAVLPLLLYHIGLWSLVALPMNLVVVPLVPLAMGLTFAAGVLGYVGTTIALPPAFLAELVLNFIIGLSLHISSLPFVSQIVPAFSAWWLLVSYGLIVAGYFYLRQPRSKIVAQGVDAVVKGWTIVEEEEYFAPRSESKKAEVDTPTHSATGETPIFFR
jgi:competence protein ComEC